MDCLRILKRLSSNSEVTLMWISGHKGIKGNEKADESVGKQTSEKVYQPKSFCGIP